MTYVNVDQGTTGRDPVDECHEIARILPHFPFGAMVVVLPQKWNPRELVKDIYYSARRKAI